MTATKKAAPRKRSAKKSAAKKAATTAVAAKAMVVTDGASFVDRNKLAAEETKAAKEAGWKFDEKAGEWTRVSGRKAKPPTPNLDAVRADHANGVTKPPKASKARTPSFVVGEAPAEAGTVAVPLLGAAQVREVKAALKGVKSHVHASNNLVVVRSEASKVAGLLAARAHETKGTAQREAWAAYLLVRAAVKSAHDESRGANPKRVNGLQALAKEGTVSAWSFVVDSTRQVAWTVSGKGLNLKDAKGRELDAALAKLEEKAAKAAA